jgi:hypothetical protein
MVTRKPVTGRLPPGHSVNVEVELKSTDDIKVVRSVVKDAKSLTIEDDFDSGGDPYNCTGQFCIPAFKDERRD